MHLPRFSHPGCRYDIVVRSPLAEDVAQRVTKGMTVVVHGRLQKVRGGWRAA